MIARVLRLAGVLAVFGLGLGLGTWWERQRALTPEQACLVHIRAIAAPKSPAWQQ